LVNFWFFGFCGGKDFIDERVEFGYEGALYSRFRGIEYLQFAKVMFASWLNGDLLIG
jgi:hypothetical protein